MNNITDFNETIAYFTYDKEKKRNYVNLEFLFNEYGADGVHEVLGLYVNKGKYGEQASAILDEVQVNLPSHLVDSVKEIRASEKIVNDINNGTVGFEIYEYYTKKYDVTSYAIRWVAIEKEEETKSDDIPF